MRHYKCNYYWEELNRESSTSLKEQGTAKRKPPKRDILQAALLAEVIQPPQAGFPLGKKELTVCCTALWIIETRSGETTTFPVSQ